MTVDAYGHQRRLLVSGALGLLAMDAVPASKLTVHHAGYVMRLRLKLGLEAATDACASRLRASLQRDPVANGFVAQGAARLQAAIGDEWQTALHTIPALVDEDVRSGRTALLGGLMLTPIELALLLG